MPDQSVPKQGLRPLSKPAQLKSLKPREKEYEVGIEACPGLRIRVSPLGKLTFFYRFTSPVTKRTVKLTLGVHIPPRIGLPATGMSLAEARARWSACNALVVNGRDPKLEMKHQADADREQQWLNTVRAEATTGKLADAYLATISNPKLDTWLKSHREVERILRVDLLSHTNGSGVAIRSRSVFEITRTDIRTALDVLRDQGKNVAANRMLASTRRMFNWAIQNDWPSEAHRLRENPCTGLVATKEQKRQRRWTDSELRVVVNRLPELLDKRTSDFLLFVLATGCRIGEAARMKWAHLIDGQWKISDTKNDNDHLVYLSEYAQSILDKQDRGGEYVWHNTASHTGHICRNSVALKLNRIQPELTVEKFTAHDFRRAVSTWLALNGSSRDVRDRILNHIHGNDIDAVYTVQGFDQMARDAWNNWGQHLQGLSSDNVVSITEERT